MTLIIGIDPGSLKTGYGIIDATGSRMQYVTSGIIRLPTAPLPERLHIICASLTRLISEYGPVEMAVEEVFFARDPRAALKLGQARGAAMVAGVQAGLPVSEYSARTVKQSVVGSGAAAKEQVQHMVVHLLKLDACPREDAADALAVAICHGHSMVTRARLAGSDIAITRARFARGRLQPGSGKP